MSRPMRSPRRIRAQQRGFTLVELAIVAVIVGLLLAGIFAGSELLVSSRAKTLAGQIEGLKAAYFGFYDRFHGYPGDYPRATQDIPNTTVNGNGDGQLKSRAQGAPIEEPIAAWEHLSRSGFVAGGYTYTAAGETPASAPHTVFGGYPRIAYGDLYAGIAMPRNNLNTGNPIPATVLAEVDRKLDDGLAISGSLRFSSIDTVGQRVEAGRCVRTTAPDAGQWRVAGTPETNCGATWLLE
ncbi:MAG: prepilin-type N-terminal cleavage/methylation domain-containing protein [Burkholderiales bacterium]|nr:prepilin-type N-terminal cleavage/methylation domain-containing protein [Burkholderiales bacterium]